MSKVLDYQLKKIFEGLKNLPNDKLVEVEDFIEFLREKYVDALKEEPKDFTLEEKDFIKSPQAERKELEKAGKYSKEFLDQFERNIAKSSIYSKKP